MCNKGEIKIKKRRERRTIATRFTCSAKEIPQYLEKAYGDVFAVMKEQKLFPLGPPFCLYYNDDMNALDMEAGIPVLGRPGEKGSVGGSFLPGGRYAVARHKGPYDRIEESYASLLEEVKARGLTPGGICFESYLNDPGKKKPEELKTDIWFLLAE